MATSGSVTFNITANTIITKALSLVAERAAEIPLTNSEVSDGLIDLNLMAKEWQAQGLHLWKRDEGILFLDAGVTSYLLGPNGAEACLLDDFINTDITTAALAGANTIVLDTSGMVAGGFIGIELDDGTRQWTTVLTVDSPTGVTITDPLTDSAEISNSVFFYTTQIERPLRVESARRNLLGNNTEVELDKWSKQEYFAQTNKGSEGTPTAFYYSPKLVDGELFIWQTSDSVRRVLKFTFQRSIEDFITTSDNPDFPIEWGNALIYGLASRIGHQYQVPLAKLASIDARAEMMLDEVLGWDEEVTSLNIQPEHYNG